MSDGLPILGFRKAGAGWRVVEPPVKSAKVCHDWRALPRAALFGPQAAGLRSEKVRESDDHEACLPVGSLALGGVFAALGAVPHATAQAPDWRASSSRLRWTGPRSSAPGKRCRRSGVGDARRREGSFCVYVIGWTTGFVLNPRPHARERRACADRGRRHRVTWNTADVPADRYVVIGVHGHDERLDSRARRPVAAPGLAAKIASRRTSMAARRSRSGIT